MPYSIDGPGADSGGPVYPGEPGLFPTGTTNLPGQRGPIGAADATPPNPPSNFKARLIDNRTVELSCTPSPYGRINQSRISQQNIRFYITPMRIEQIQGGIDPSQYNALFARAVVIGQLLAPPSGQLVRLDFDFQASGVGIYWATQYNSRALGSLESKPAGPAILLPSDYQSALDAIPPDVVSVTGATLSPVASPAGSNHLYVEMFITYTAPTNTSHFFGVVPYYVNYFSNFIGANLIEGSVFPWDGKASSTIHFPFVQADYNSAGVGSYTIAHNVTVYLVSINEAHIFRSPYTGHGSNMFVNGIGL